MKNADLIIGLCLIFKTAVVTAAPVVVTPGSMAGYTYFAPSAPNSGSGGSGVGDEVSTLQRCVFTPTTGDQTVTVDQSLLYGYTKLIPVNYVVVGGDGGYTMASGGGGSSAILLNGTVQVIGPGADGGQLATPIRGRFSIKANDSIRFVTGGGGGGGIDYQDTRGNRYVAGGGGGAGYQGGGAGASHPSAVIPVGSEQNAHGKGGGSSPGAGGFLTGGFNGTNGSSLEGGVSTFPDGSAAPIGSISNAGTPSASYFFNSYYMGGATPSQAYMTATPSRFSANASRQGAPSRPVTLYANGSCYVSGGCWTALINRQSVSLSTGGYYETGMFYAAAGGGGTLGRAGSNIVMGRFANSNAYGSFGQHSFDASNNVNSTVNNSGNMFNMTPSSTIGSSIGVMTKPGMDMELTRPNTGAVNGANPGQIVIQYQAPVCGLLR